MSFKKRAQVSFEYMAIFGVAALMLIPLIIIFASQTGTIEADIAYAQTENALSRIVDSAEEIYFQGHPSKKTLRVQFPKGISEIVFRTDSLTHEIVFVLETIDGSFNVSKQTSARIDGYLETFPGSHIIVFQAFEDVVYIQDK
jgi:hypothetical protein